jgi:hypothetical protein
MTADYQLYVKAGRESYIAGLRKLADALEAHPEIPMPGQGSSAGNPLLTYFFGDDAREQMAAARRALGCPFGKGVDEKWLKLNGQMEGLHLQLYAGRDAVCTRRVVGTEEREVEEEITPAVTEKVVKTIEIVEWDCHPILGDGDSEVTEP